MKFNDTVKGSALEGFYPAGWDFDKIDACIDAPEKITERQAHWNDGFNPIRCDSLGEFETYRISAVQADLGGGCTDRARFPAAASYPAWKLHCAILH